jgi:hypothetical protein
MDFTDSVDFDAMEIFLALLLLLDTEVFKSLETACP